MTFVNSIVEKKVESLLSKFNLIPKLEQKVEEKL